MGIFQGLERGPSSDEGTICIIYEDVRRSRRANSNVQWVKKKLRCISRAARRIVKLCDVF
jgi:hypothetical protein